VNAQPHSYINAPHGAAALFASMAHTRLELAVLDIEGSFAAIAAAFACGVLAAVVAMVAFAFIGATVIAVFWDTHRVLAASGVTAGYLLLAGCLALGAQRRWRTRPSVFAGLLRELDRDRAALRGTS
jgi:uncharacterized membrane protein YqjE